MSLTERNPLIIGLVAIAVILGGSLAALVVKGDTFSPTYPLTADFADAAGLHGGDLVAIAGVRVGHVGRIRSQGDRVVVTLEINHGVQVARGSTAAIVVATLLGRMEVALSSPPGANWSDLYAGGEHIPGVGTSPTQVLDVQADAQKALATLDSTTVNTLLADLAQVTTGKAAQVDAIVAGLDRLTSTVDSRSSEVSTLIDAANAVSGTVESRNANLLRAIDSLDTVVANLDARRAELTRLLETTQQAASKIAGLIGANRAQLDAVLVRLQTSLDVIDRHQLDLAQAVSYLAGAIGGFSSVGYSGPRNAPNTWGNIYTVGVGPASGDPTFGCNGELDLVLTVAIGPDPVTNCQQYTGPIPGGTASGAPAARRQDAGTLRPSAQTTRDGLNALLVPLLSGAAPATGAGG